jgi:hypothetical protein
MVSGDEVARSGSELIRPGGILRTKARGRRAGPVFRERPGGLLRADGEQRPNRRGRRQAPRPVRALRK